jgi:tRNA nucleotidyltransferase (CCA-adding enzyme)
LRQLVLSHVGTDFDGLASMVLAQKLYPGSYLVFPGRMGPGVKEFFDLHKRHFQVMERKEALRTKPDRLIVVDTRTPSRLGEFRQWVHDSEVELYIYDHHRPTAESVRGDQEWVEPVGAAATLLVERCRAEKLPIETWVASLCLIAIHEETGSFRYDSVTPRDLEAAAYLMAQGANLEVVGDFLKDPLTDGQRSLLEEFLRTGQVYQGRSGSLYVGHAQRKRSVFGMGSLATRILEIEDTDAVCVVLEAEGEGTSIAARAGSDAFDVSVWMARYGGGGHKRAASASRIPESAEKVAKELVVLASEGQGAKLTAADVMSSDLFTLSPNCTVEHANSELLARGYHAAVVVDGQSEMQGLVCRTDLNRALDHNLGHAPARSVMTHKVVSVNHDDSLDDVRRVVVERHVGSLPVMQDGRLVGIVTRTDLLREIYQQGEEENWNRSGGGPKVCLGDLNEPYLSRLRVAARLAAEKRVRLYVVGGFVRDLLLGRPSDDVDLVVEGDAILLAKALRDELGGKVVTHEKYMTASLKFADDDKLDVASARKEVYVRPAAMPDVAQSKLKSDLYRRDFTINALALRLSDNLEATVIDFFGGRQDLDTKKIRVLHNHSFIDDPTRIIRAVRFEQRLGFSIEPHTKQLIRGALETDVFRLAHGERIAEELKLALSESDPVKVLSRMQKLKILRALHPELKFEQKQKARTEQALQFMKTYPHLVSADSAWLVPLMFLHEELSEEGRELLKERFGWKAAPWPFPVNDLLSALIRKDLSPSEIAHYLDPLDGRRLAVLAGIANHPVFFERMDLYIKKIRDMEPLISGRDILSRGVPQGPDVKEWKRRAYDAQRDGEFDDRAGALAWLHQMAKLPAP